jgi:hypothetical protein
MNLIYAKACRDVSQSANCTPENEALNNKGSDQ